MVNIIKGPYSEELKAQLDWAHNSLSLHVLTHSSSQGILKVEHPVLTDTQAQVMHLGNKFS